MACTLSSFGNSTLVLEYCSIEGFVLIFQFTWKVFPKSRVCPCVSSVLNINLVLQLNDVHVVHRWKSFSLEILASTDQQLGLQIGWLGDIIADFCGAMAVQIWLLELLRDNILSNVLFLSMRSSSLWWHVPCCSKQKCAAFAMFLASGVRLDKRWPHTPQPWEACETLAIDTTKQFGMCFAASHSTLCKAWRRRSCVLFVHSAHFISEMHQGPF